MTESLIFVFISNVIYYLEKKYVNMTRKKRLTEYYIGKLKKNKKK